VFISKTNAMKVDIAHNDALEGIELLFSEELPTGLSSHLRRIGFKQVHGQHLKWYASQHPAYLQFAETLQKILLKEGNYLTVPLQPSFNSSKENIENGKFRNVTIFYKEMNTTHKETYVLFDSYKAVATEIATRFGKNKYHTSFQKVEIATHKSKPKARTSFKEGKIILGENPKTSSPKEEKATPLKGYVKFENEVIYQMELLGEITTSDAQGILMPHEDFLKQEFEKLPEPTEEDAKQLALGILQRATPEPKEKPVPEQITNKQQPNKYNYLDHVIAHLHEQFAEGKRPTKKQIDDLKDSLGIPNRGMVWEAAELAWLLWYKAIYKEPIPFEQRLNKMIHFWNTLQPTYHYSDSSKEFYKQYSTPCPISAIVAQYTGMGNTSSILEPSAGNGLLLVGANPQKVHANEIDQTRLASLHFQQFKTITSHNATQPFPDNMKEEYDVVITNPPFSRWEEEKFDKTLLVRKYFNKHVGLAKHIRLEHLMAGLALHCMKATGKAAIIIMGHIYFDKDGYIARYRPFFNWLFRNYQVDDVINLNSFKLYNKQGAVERTMLILVNGRKSKPKGVAPKKEGAPHLEEMVNSFAELWKRVKQHISGNLDNLIQQLKIELAA